MQQRACMSEGPNEPLVDLAEPVEANELARTHHEGGARASHRRGARSGSSGHSIRGKRSQRLMLAIALAISLLVLLIVGVVAGVRIDDLTSELQTAQSEAAQARNALAKAMPELQQARKELSNLIKGQFPHLQELAPDKVIKLNNPYIKNIVFTVLNKNGRAQYEYRLVIENTTDSMMRPNARIFVFDHRGAQIGMGEVNDRADMVPGESRSYSSTIERFLDEEPRYFFVWNRAK